MGLAAGAVAGLTGCGFVAGRLQAYERKKLPKNTVAAPEEERVLNLTGFGPNAASLFAYRTLGKRAYIEAQLRGNETEDVALTMQLQRLDVLQMEPADIIDLPIENVLGQLQQAAILQAVYGRNQLRERMVDFWSNHFNIYARKGNTAFSKGVEESKVVREHALGRFPDMLNAMAHSPAMLESLDNQYNHKGVANENYARELMELHTLGLHGGYTQKDVQEVARCFTGWTIENRFLRPRGRFRFDPDRHDTDSKIVLGVHIPAGGDESDGNTVLTLLARHTSTAKFLARKLATFFLGKPDPKWIGVMSQAYLQSGGDIPSMLRPLMGSDDLVSNAPVLKRPYDYMISALRVTEATTDGGPPIQTHLNQMGEPLYQWPMPDGYPVKTAAWTSSLLPRWNFALALTNGQISRTSISSDILSAGAKGLPLEAAKRAPMVQEIGTENELALFLSSPEFQWR